MQEQTIKSKLQMASKAVNRTVQGACLQTLTLLPELWFAFLHCGHDHVAHSSRGQTVQTPLDALH